MPLNAVYTCLYDAYDFSELIFEHHILWSELDMDSRATFQPVGNPVHQIGALQNSLSAEEFVTWKQEWQ